MQINKKNIKLFNELKSQAQEGKGSILLVTGESGFGKSFLIKQMIQECNEPNNRVLNVYVQNEIPIGDVNVHNLQPLKPFAKALEVILESKNITAKKQLALNMSLTTLTALPFIGDVFYAAKELSRDWRQYKKEKTDEVFEVEENRADELINAFALKAEKGTIVLFMDNMQFVDGASVELLQKIKKKIAKLNILIVLAYRKSDAENPQIPFYHFISESKDLDQIELKEFTKDDTIRLSKIYINNYKENEEFDDWLYNKTLGNPGELFEYFDYFKSIKAFDEKGDLQINLESELIPTNAKAALASSLNELTLEEKDLLASAAQEGNEFSVFLLADIMNTDILKIIRTLKSIQEKSKIIRSIGSYKRYGVKTTVYQFTQVFYFTYFNSYLEYEEQQNIHSLISNFLQKQLNTIESPEEKKEVMAYIISHSQHSGDEELADKTTAEMRQLAKDTNDKELLISLGESSTFNSDNLTVQNTNSNGNGMGNSLISFGDLRKLIVRDYLKGEYLKPTKMSNDYLANEKEYLTNREIILLLTMTAKLEISSGDYPNAKKHIIEAENILEQEQDKSLECLILNINASLHNKQGHYSRAGKFLRKAADLAISLPAELRLLTLSNISILLESESPEESIVYKNAAEKLKSELEYNNWWN